MRKASAIGFALLGSALAVAASPSENGTLDDALAPEAVQPLAQLAKDLAKAGRAEELDELLELVQRAGMAASEAGSLATSTRTEASRVRKPAAALPAAAKLLQRIASRLSARLDSCGDERRPELAQLILRLDDEQEAAQRALGREKVGGDWLDAQGRARRARAAEIASALAASRALEFKIETGRSTDRVFLHPQERPPSFVRSGVVTLHGVWPAEKLARVLRGVLRALALDNFLMTGKLELPELQPAQLAFLDSNRDFAEVVRLGREKHWIRGDAGDDPEKIALVYFGDELVGNEVIESSMAASTLLELLWHTRWKGAKEFCLGNNVQEYLISGLTNWTCLSCFGARMGLYVYEKTRDQDGAGGTASLNPVERAIRERYRVLSAAGISGGRTWMRYLAGRREDPPLPSLLVDQMGKLQGDPLLKMTLVVEMLGQDGPLLPFAKRLPARLPGKTQEEIFAAACGTDLPAFDASWRRWLLPAPRGLTARLREAKREEEPLAPAERQVLDALNDLRRRASAVEPPIDFDREATASCRKHALFLARNPAQATRWPDVHEEYPDQPGFDPAGAWAGTHAVVATGVKDGRAALDRWMATFYHRIPLLEAGLVRIGFAMDSNTAVLDVDSFVRDRETIFVADGGRWEIWSILWPPNGANGVPTSYVSELPKPVPGEDETKMGYPITLQLARTFIEASPEIELSLHAGTEEGPEVPCWFSTPKQPTNPQLAPDAAWCLIPKKSLQSGSQYAVVAIAHWVGVTDQEVRFSWSFHCGR